MYNNEDLAEILKEILAKLHKAEEMVLAIPFEPTYDYQDKIETARLEVSNILNAVDQFDMDMTDEYNLMNHPALLTRLKNIIDTARQNLQAEKRDGLLDELDNFIDDTSVPDNYRAIAIEEYKSLKKHLN